MTGAVGTRRSRVKTKLYLNAVGETARHQATRPWRADIIPCCFVSSSRGRLTIRAALGGGSDLKSLHCNVDEKGGHSDLIALFAIVPGKTPRRLKDWKNKPPGLMCCSCYLLVLLAGEDDSGIRRQKRSVMCDNKVKRGRAYDFPVCLFFFSVCCQSS